MSKGNSLSRHQIVDGVEQDPQISRLAIVSSTDFGEVSSGFLLAPTLVVTALHGVRRSGGPNVPCEVVTFPKHRDGAPGTSARIIWPAVNDPAEHHDVAVLELSEPIEIGDDYRVRIGGFGSDSSGRFDARAVGFANAASSVDAGERSAFVPFAVSGWLDSASRWPDELQVTTAGEAPAERGTGWSGMSGASIFVVDSATNIQTIVGIVTTEPRAFGSPDTGSRDLVGCRISALFDDPRFADALSSIPYVTIGDDVGFLAEKLAEITISAIDRYEALPGMRVSKLIRDETRRLENTSQRDSRLCDQDGAFEKIMDAVNASTPPLLALGGMGGVGKSTVMRQACRMAAINFLDRSVSANRTRAPLPLFINLGAIVIESSSRQKMVGPAMLDWWIDMANGFLGRSQQRSTEQPIKSINYSDLLGISRRYGLIGFLDSTDEFLERNPEFEAGDLLDWISEMPAEITDDVSELHLIASAPFEQAVVARRSSLQGGGLIAERSHQEIILTHLSDDETEKLLPEGLWAELTDSLDVSTRELLCTPFIAVLLKDYGDRRLRVLAAEPHLQRLFKTSETAGRVTPGALLEFAFRCYLFREDAETSTSGYFSRAVHNFGAFAMILLSAEQSELSKSELLQSHVRYPFIPADEIEEHLEFGRTRGILQTRRGNNDEELYSFSHQIWQDFSAAWLVADRLQHNDPSVLAERTHYSRVWRLIGYFLALRDFEFTAELFHNAVKTGKQFVYGSIIAIFAYAPVPISNSALEAIGTSIKQLSPLARHVLIGSFGARVIAGWTDDRSLGAIRTACTQWCHDVLNDPSMPQVSKSIAACISNEIQPSNDQLSDNFEIGSAFEECYPFALAVAPGYSPTAVQQRSLEIGYLDIFTSALSEPFRILTATHFVFMLAACIERGPSRSETLVDLFRLMRSRDKMVGDAKKQFSKVTAERVETILNYTQGVLDQKISSR